MKRILALLALMPTLALAQAPNFPQVMPPNTVYGRLAIGPGPGQAIPFSALSGLLTNPIQLTNTPLSPIDLKSTIPVNGFYASGSGAIFNTHNGPGDEPRVAFYLRATAVQPYTIPEYMAVFDCNLNAGKGAPTLGMITDNKVCFYDAAVTGPNSGSSSWASATNMVIGAGDTGIFKITAEFDITNNAADCAVGTGRNCYAIYVSGDVANPVTAMVALALPTGTGLPAAHFGILINGRNVAKDVDVENSGGAQAGFCNSCLLIPGAGDPTTHSVAGFLDNSITPVGMGLRGTYPVTDPSNSTNKGGALCFESSDAVCIGWNGDVLYSRFPLATSFLQARATSNVASLNTTAPCNATHVGFRSNVVDGVAGPALGSAVGSATGTTFQPVVCNGTVWVYG